MSDHFIFVEKYRPQSVDECILPESIKAVFQDFVKTGDIPNMLLTGTSGVGKTTVAKALAKQLDMEVMMINGSEEGNIDTLRTKIKGFASTNSLNNNKKIVILDEADYLNPQSTQPALRGFMEEYADNCRFILTCNYKNKILKELHSRCTTIEFRIPPEEKPEIAKQFFQRAKAILASENIKYENAAVVGVIKKYFPDFRKILNELQRYGAGGIIDAGILTNIAEQNVVTLISFLKEKQFDQMRKWVVENLDQDPTTIVRSIYDHGQQYIEPTSLPEAIIILDEYLFKHAFVADPEINMVAMMVELMGSVQWKK